MSRNKFSPTKKRKSKSIVFPKSYVETEKPSRSCSTELFLARVSNARRSYYINTSNDRTIYVQQYAQKSEYLLNEQTLLPEVNNNESTVLLFFIHGVGGSSHMWDPQVEYFLNEGYDIVTLDLIGHGLSSKPRNYSAYEFSNLAEDVLYIFDMFCKKRNVLIGHSYGSSFCTLISKERCEKVAKLILISGGGPTALMPDKCSTFCLPLPMFMFIQPAIVKVFRRMAFHVDTSQKIRKKLTTFGISAHTLKAVMQGQNWPEAGEQYHSDLLVPVLLIYGRGDQFVSLDDELWMNETIYGSHLEIIENAGHMVMIECPSVVNNAIHRFLSRDSTTRLGSVQEITRKQSIKSHVSTLTHNNKLDLTNLENLNEREEKEEIVVCSSERKDFEMLSPEMSLAGTSRRGSWFDAIHENEVEKHEKRSTSRMSCKTPQSKRLERKIMF